MLRTRVRDDANAALLRGAAVLADLLKVSYGPHGAPIVITSPSNPAKPELVTRSAVVARRLIEVDEPFTNMGMLIARQVACRVDDAVGDGAATAVLIYHRLLKGAFRLRAAGADMHRIADELRAAAASTDRALAEATLPLTADEAARAVARSAGLDPALGRVVERAVLAMGDDGTIELAHARGIEPELELIEGFHARATITRPSQRSGVADFGPAVVLVSDDPWSDVTSIARLAAAAKADGWSTMLLVAPTVGDAVRAAIAGVSDPAMTVVAAEVGPDGASLLPDLAAHLGTTPVAAVLGDDIRTLGISRLGRVRRGWTSRGRFGVVAGAPSAEGVARARELRAAAERTDDPAVARSLCDRAGIIDGTSAILRVPVMTEAEAGDGLERVESVVRAARLAVTSGVVAGGGAALATIEPEPPTIGAELLREALTEPARVLALRAGLQPSAHVEHLRSLACGERIDVATGARVPADAIEVVDPADVVRAAVRIAVSAAVTALGTVSLLRVPNPAWSVVP